MWFEDVELMGALLLWAAMGLVLHPSTPPHNYPKLERALASLTTQQFLDYTICAQSEGMQCGFALAP